MKNFKMWLSNITIKSKIILLHAIVTMISFLITFTVFSAVNKKYTENEIKNAGIQTVQALKGNLSFIFDNVTQFSNLIYFDDTVQRSLKQIDKQSIEPTVLTTIKKSLANMIVSGNFISSVFIFDQYNNSYSSYKMGPINPRTDLIESTDWCTRMYESNGNGFFIHKSEGVLEFASRQNQNYISYIREIRSKDDYKAMAILLVTIDAETIQDYFKEIGGDYNSNFFIMDGDGNYIIEPIGYEGDYSGYVESVGKKNTHESITIYNNKIIFVSQPLDIQDWQLVGAFRINAMEVFGHYYGAVILFVICLNILFIFSCSTILTRLIFIPMYKLESHMCLIEQNEFIPIQVDHKNNEINHLKRVYNHMISSIQTLIQKVKEEEQIIAKSELDILYAQINPHFLYNTLDAVSALALINDNKNCFKMTQALGIFYRNSLNSGLDYISVRDEIQCIQNYMTIINIRYDGKIKTEYDIEDEIMQFPIIKLVLQPVVENAVYHGINPNGGEGTITIKGFRNEDELIFIISDDGTGMTEERICEVMDGRSLTGKSGFGIYSLIQRLQIYYKIDNPIIIQSECGSGTEVTICVKFMEDELDANKGINSR